MNLQTLVPLSLLVVSMFAGGLDDLPFLGDSTELSPSIPLYKSLNLRGSAPFVFEFEAPPGQEVSLHARQGVGDEEKQLWLLPLGVRLHVG